MKRLSRTDQGQLLPGSRLRRLGRNRGRCLLLLLLLRLLLLHWYPLRLCLWLLLSLLCLTATVTKNSPSLIHTSWCLLLLLRQLGWLLRLLLQRPL